MHSLLPKIIYISNMDTEMLKKQTFLREQILEKQYDPQEFIEFLDSKLKIGDDLTLCTFEQLKSVVEIFVSLQSSEQAEEKAEEEPKSELLLKSEVKPETKSVVKPRTILFVCV